MDDDTIRIPAFKRGLNSTPHRPDYSFSFKNDDGEWVKVVAVWDSISKKGNQYLKILISEKGLLAYKAKQEKENELKPDPDGSIIL